MGEPGRGTRLEREVAVLGPRRFFVCGVFWGFENPFGALVSRGIYIHAMFFFKSVPLLWGFSHEPLASGPGARRWRGWQDLKPVYLVALGRFLSHFLWAVRTAPGETPVFRSIRDCGRNQCFRCFCGSVGSAVFDPQ